MNSPIRILQVLAGMNRGGAETFIMNVYRKIDKTKVQFDFLLFREEECDFNEEILDLGGKIYWIPRYIGKNHFKYIKAWKTFFKNHPEYKIIHGHVRSTASVYLKIANNHGLTTIAHSHSTSSRGSLVERLVKKSFQLPIRYIADYLFSCSDEAGEWLYGRKSIKKDKYHLLKNAIDTEAFKYNRSIREEKRRELGIQNNKVIGHVGSFTPPKNHTFIVDVFKEIYGKDNDAVLLLVGDGKLRSAIIRKIRDLNLTESVVMTGVRSDVPELLQAMDIMVFPSIFEGLPVTLIEAQASGLPCIVADTITPDVGISDSLKFMSIERGPDQWSDHILKTEIDQDRRGYSRIIKEEGYDIYTEASWLQNFYLENNQLHE